MEQTTQTSRSTAKITAIRVLLADARNLIGSTDEAAVAEFTARKTRLLATLGPVS